MEATPFTFTPVKAPKGKLKSRILGFGYCKVKDLMEHPHNWREHTVRQGEAVKESMKGIGWTEALIVNTRTGDAWEKDASPVILNGHLRKKLVKEMGDEYAPVIFLDLDPEEEAFTLATLDPLASLAVNNQEKLSELVSHSKNLETALKAALRGAGLDPRNQVISDAEKREVTPEEEGAKNQKTRNAASPTPSKASTPDNRAKYPLAIVLDGRDYMRWMDLKEKLSLKSDSEALLYLMARNEPIGKKET